MNRISGLLLIIALVLGVTGLSFYTLTDPHPKRLADGLQSAEGKDLEHPPCAGTAPAGAIALSLGNAALWFQGFPHTVVTVGGQPQFALDRNADGSIAPDLRIFVGTKELGHLHGVTLQDESNGQLKLTRPSGSELIVSTSDGTTVAQIDYLNDHTIQLSGHLAFGGHDFLMPPDGFALDGKTLSGTCIGGGKTVDFAY
jgi:hypothetical protein